MLAPLLLLAVNLPASQSATLPDVTPLMKAAARNDLKSVRNLIAHGASVNQKARGGETALNEAIERHDPKRNNLAVVNALLAAGADPNESAIFGLSPLVLSLTRDHLNSTVTLRLLAAGANVPQGCEGADSVVSLATQDSSVEVIAALLARGAAANCQDAHGETALHWAAMNGEADRVALLLRNGADPHLRNNHGKTAMDVAVTGNTDQRVQDAFSKTRDLLETVAKGHT